MGKTSLVGELETIVEVKAPAAKIHEVFSRRPHIVTSTSHKSVQSCELLEGEWGKVGSVIFWRFCRDTDESTRIAKELVEVIDDENFITSFKLIEGSALEKYKSFYSTAKVTPKEEGSLVHWTYKYEKQNEDDPDLESQLLQLAINNIKDIDAYLLTEQQLQA